MTKWKFATCASLTALLALSSGCIISSDDGGVDSGVFHATWDVNGGRTPAACDAAQADKVSFLFTRDAGALAGFAWGSYERLTQRRWRDEQRRYMESG